MRDVTTATLHTALHGLSTRRRVIAQNIANVETGGYLAGRVDFEQSLAQALDSARSPRAGRAAVSGIAPQRQTSTEATNLNGNNVNLDDEIMLQEQTELAWQTVLEAINGKYRLLRSAINGGS